jgi:hypothetical protein
VTRLANNQVQLQTFSGRWVGLSSNAEDAQLVSVAATPSGWETFTVTYVEQQKAVNLGAWFLPEKWMFGSNSALYRNTNAHDLYQLSLELGQTESSNRMRSHWSSFITETDFANMKNRGVRQQRPTMNISLQLTILI